MPNTDRLKQLYQNYQKVNPNLSAMTEEEFINGMENPGNRIELWQDITQNMKGFNRTFEDFNTDMGYDPVDQRSLAKQQVDDVGHRLGEMRGEILIDARKEVQNTNEEDMGFFTKLFRNPMSEAYYVAKADERNKNLDTASQQLLEAEVNLSSARKSDEYTLGSNTKNFFKGVLGGLAKDANTIASYGLSDIKDAVTLGNVFEKVAKEDAYENPEKVLSKEEQILFDAYASNIASQLATQGDKAWMSSAGEMSGQMAAFVLEIATGNKLFSGMTKSGAKMAEKALLKAVAKKITNNTGKRFIANVGKTAIGMAEKGARSALTVAVAPRTYAHGIENQTTIDVNNGIEFDNRGNLHIAQIDEQGGAGAFAQAFADDWLEAFTETGGAFKEVGGAFMRGVKPTKWFGKVMQMGDKFMDSKAGQYIKNSHLGRFFGKSYVQDVTQALKTAGYDGTIEESLEELEGAMWKGELGDFFKEDNLMPMLISFGAMGAVAGASDYRVSRKIKGDYSRASEMLNNALEGISEKDKKALADQLLADSYGLPLDRLGVSIDNAVAQLMPEEYKSLLELRRDPQANSESIKGNKAKKAIDAMYAYVYSSVRMSGIDEGLRKEREELSKNSYDIGQQKLYENARSMIESSNPGESFDDAVMEEATRNAVKVAHTNGNIYLVSDEKGRQGVVVSGATPVIGTATVTDVNGQSQEKKKFDNDANDIVTVRWSDGTLQQVSPNSLNIAEDENGQQVLPMRTDELAMQYYAGAIYEQDKQKKLAEQQRQFPQGGSVTYNGKQVPILSSENGVITFQNVDEEGNPMTNEQGEPITFGMSFEEALDAFGEQHTAEDESTIPQEEYAPKGTRVFFNPTDGNTYTTSSEDGVLIDEQGNAVSGLDISQMQELTQATQTSQPQADATQADATVVEAPEAQVAESEQAPQVEYASMPTAQAYDQLVTDAGSVEEATLVAQQMVTNTQADLSRVNKALERTSGRTPQEIIQARKALVEKRNSLQSQLQAWQALAQEQSAREQASVGEQAQVMTATAEEDIPTPQAQATQAEQASQAQEDTPTSANAQAESNPSSNVANVESTANTQAVEQSNTEQVNATPAQEESTQTQSVPTQAEPAQAQEKKPNTKLALAQQLQMDKARKVAEDLKNWMKDFRPDAKQNVVIIESLDEIPESEKTARESLKKGNGVMAWVHSGKAYLYLPNIVKLSTQKDALAKAKSKIFHELVAHYNLPQMLGKKRFAELCQHVWDDIMNEDARQYMMRYHVMYNLAKDWDALSEEEKQSYLNDAKAQQGAADEYIAHLAESKAQDILTMEEQSAWDKFLEIVRYFLRDMGLMDVNDMDLESLIIASYVDLKTNKSLRTNDANADAEATSSQVASVEDNEVRTSTEELDDSGVRFSVRTKEPPKETRTAYKLFRVDKDGNPMPLFIDANKALPVDTWLDADSPANLEVMRKQEVGKYFVDNDGNITRVESVDKKMIDNATKEGNGRYMEVDTYANGKKAVYNIGINGSGTTARFAMRPGWHATDAPSARHIGAGKNGGESKYRRPNQRWFEIEVSADVDYNEEATAYQGKSGGIEDHIPTDGWYQFQTNSNANPNQQWIISGAIRILRPLNEQEAKDICAQKGVTEDLPYKDGKKDFVENDKSIDKQNLRFSVEENDSNKTSLDIAQGVLKAQEDAKKVSPLTRTVDSSTSAQAKVRLNEVLDDVASNADEAKTLKELVPQTSGVRIDDSEPVRFSVSANLVDIGYIYQEAEDGVLSIKDDKGKSVSKVTADYIMSHVSPFSIAVNEAVASGRISKDVAKVFVDAQVDIMNYVLDKARISGTEDYDIGIIDAIYKWVGTDEFYSIKNNSDSQYSLSMEMTTICKKVEMMAYNMGKWMAEEGRGITPYEIVKMYEFASQTKFQVPCPQCYVFSRWFIMGGTLGTMYNAQEMYKDKLVDESLMSNTEANIRSWYEEYKKQAAFSKKYNKQANVAKKENGDIVTLTQDAQYAKEMLRKTEEERKKQIESWKKTIGSLNKRNEELKNQGVDSDEIQKNESRIANAQHFIDIYNGKVYYSTYKKLGRKTYSLPAVEDTSIEELDKIMIEADKRLLRNQDLITKCSYATWISNVVLENLPEVKPYLKDTTERNKELEKREKLLAKGYLLVEVDSKGKEIYARIRDNHAKHPFGNENIPILPTKEYIFDIGLSADLKKYYPNFYRYKPTRGAAGGKAVETEADNKFGEVIQGIQNVDNLNKGKNALQTLFKFAKEKGVSTSEMESYLTEEAVPKDKELNTAIKDYKNSMGKATKNITKQMIKGGNRVFSWSDYRGTHGLDLMLNFMQLSMLGASIQSYSKQLEGMDFFASIGAYVNGSLIGHNKGYIELGSSQEEAMKRYEEVKAEQERDASNPNGDYYSVRYSEPVEVDGKWYALSFDTKLGIDYDGLMGLCSLRSHAGNITIGMSDLHIKILLRHPKIYFSIPWHSSGNGTHIVALMAEAQGSYYDENSMIDYEKVQGEKDMKEGTYNKLGWERMTNTALYHLQKLGYSETQAKKLVSTYLHNGGCSPSQKLYRQAFDAACGKDYAIGADKEAIDKLIATDTYLKQIKETLEKNGIEMTGSKDQLILPWMYWDTTSEYGEHGEGANINGSRYIDFCMRLGQQPKFIALFKGQPYHNNGKELENITMYDGYWKVLVDRRMYDVNGKYQTTNPISFVPIEGSQWSSEDVSGFKNEFLFQEAVEEKWGGYTTTVFNKESQGEEEFNFIREKMNGFREGIRDKQGEYRFSIEDTEEEDSPLTTEEVKSLDEFVDEYMQKNGGNRTKNEMVRRALHFAAEASHGKQNFAIQIADLRRKAKDLRVISSALSSQRNFDKNLAHDLLSIVSLILETNKGTHYKGMYSRLFSAVKNAIGSKGNIDNQLDKFLDALTYSQMKLARSKFYMLLNTRRNTVNASGVVTQGKVGVKGQSALATINLYMSSSPKTIDDRLSEVEQILDNIDQNDPRRLELEGQQAGLIVALHYQEEMQSINEENNNLTSMLGETMNDVTLRAQERKEAEHAIRQRICANRIDAMELYTRCAQELGSIVIEEQNVVSEFLTRQKLHRQEIRRMARLDTEGTKVNPFRKKTKQGLARQLLDGFLSPMHDMQSLLRMLGTNSMDGEGYLYKHFMSKYIESADKEYVGLADAQQRMDEAVQRIFKGANGIKTWADLQEWANKQKYDVCKLTQVKALNEEYDVTLSTGQAMYIYAVNKMADGRMKLRRMGITEENVEAIGKTLDPRLIQVIDWVQEDFFTQQRIRYNATHQDLFGASMDAIDNYFPLVINGDARRENSNIESDDESAGRMLSGTSTGAIKRRSVNSLPLDITNADFFAQTTRHIKQMEHWNAFAQFTRDANIMLSDITLRNRVKNMSNMYGSGEELYNQLKKAMEVAVGSYRPKVNAITRSVNAITKGITSSKINGRIFTAIKQLASFPAFFGYASNSGFTKSFAHNAMHPAETYKWAMENLPNLRKRFKKGDLGDFRLMDNANDVEWLNKIQTTVNKVGMYPNKFIDCFTCAMGAKAVYDSRERYYKEIGFSEEEAKKKALYDAETAFNTSQQSSEGAFVAPMQMDKDLWTVGLTTFQTSQIQYTRAFLASGRSLFRKWGKKEEMINFRKQQYIDEGLTAEQAINASEKDFRKSVISDVSNLVIFGAGMNIVWRLMANIPYYIFGGDDKEKRKLTADSFKPGVLTSPFLGIPGMGIVQSALDGYGMWTDMFAPKLPFVGDLEKLTRNIMGGQYMDALSQLSSIVVSSFTGLDFQTLSQGLARVALAFDNDVDGLNDFAILISGCTSVPQSQYEQIMLDAYYEGNYSKDKLREEYIQYYLFHTGSIFDCFRSKEEEKEARKKANQRFNKLVKERNATRRN